MVRLIQILTNTCGHNADKALHREGYITLWTNYQNIANKHGCADALHYFEVFVVFFKLLRGFYPYITFCKCSTKLPVLSQCIGA